MIRGWIKTSMMDWDGKLVTVLFFDRCNFSCPYCQNWKLLRQPDDYPAINLATVLRQLSADRDWIDGVVLTGGEPLLDANELRTVIKQIKALNFKIKIDTNGSLPAVLQELIDEQLVDYVAMDVKASLDARYAKAAGIKIPPELIRASIKIIMAGARDYEFRTTLVPGIIDEIAIRQIGKELRGAKKWFLQIFISAHAPPGVYQEKKFTAAEIDRLLMIAREYLPGTQLRGKRE